MPVDNQTITCSVVFGTEEESGRRRQLPFDEELLAYGRSFTRIYRKLKDQPLLFKTVF